MTEINTSPTLTWNWLKMNRAYVDLKQFDSLEKTEESVEITAKKGEKKTEILHLNFENGKAGRHHQVITAEEGADLTVILDYSSDKDAGGFSEIKTQLIAKDYARIHLIKVQLLGSGFTQIDETLGNCADSANITVTQLELGADKVYAKVWVDLDGYHSTFKSDTGYFCAKKQIFDFNYLVNHYGKETDTKMSVKGTVTDDALKVYRGTIDFKNGCKGATGDEQEETLILSPTAINKSMPNILCDEEDVSGTHGATIGRLGSEELFYMQARGISEEEAKRLMSNAKIISIAHTIPDENLVSRIENYIGE